MKAEFKSGIKMGVEFWRVSFNEGWNLLGFLCVVLGGSALITILLYLIAFLVTLVWK
jgi:hypothetical protein